MPSKHLITLEDIPVGHKIKIMENTNIGFFRGEINEMDWWGNFTCHYDYSINIVIINFPMVFNRNQV